MNYYKITAISMWVRPQVFFAESEEEKNQILFDLKSQQYKVEVEEIEG